MDQGFTENKTFRELKAKTKYSYTVKVSSTDKDVAQKAIQASFVTGDLSK